MEVQYRMRKPTVSQPEKGEYTRVIGHKINVFIVLVDDRVDQAVDVATMFTVSSPHRICIVYRVTWGKAPPQGKAPPPPI